MHSLDLSRGSTSGLSFQVASKAMWVLRCLFSEPESDSQKGKRKSWITALQMKICGTHLVHHQPAFSLSLGIKSCAGKKPVMGSHLWSEEGQMCNLTTCPMGQGDEHTGSPGGLWLHISAMPPGLRKNGSFPSRGVIARTVQFGKNKAVLCSVHVHAGYKSSRHTLTQSPPPWALQAPWQPTRAQSRGWGLGCTMHRCTKQPTICPKSGSAILELLAFIHIHFSE